MDASKVLQIVHPFEIGGKYKTAQPEISIADRIDRWGITPYAILKDPGLNEI
ncbi:MAG: hypothetical protein JETCAE01_22760 [Anaerolineaceae bacterium]|nr:MAG: hypothetical protein JETCAE01_22760 [Anaerolineaceae bacterium]